MRRPLTVAHATTVGPRLGDRPGGELGTVCIYEAESPEAIRAHAEAAELPVDEIVPVADTVIVRPDPAPVTA